MSKISIKKQSLPERCEVCHQNDEFDAHNNYCQRCAGQQKTNLKLVKQDEKSEPTIQSILNALRIESTEWHRDNITAMDQLKMIKEAQAKLRLEEQVEKQCKNIREWRIKNRKKYRETMDFVLFCVNPDIEPELLEKRPLEEKLVLSHDVASFDLTLLIIQGMLAMMIGIASTLIMFLPFNFPSRDAILISALFSLSLYYFVSVRVIFFHKKTSLRWLSFYWLYKRWNRKVNGQEVSFDPSVTVVKLEYMVDWRTGSYYKDKDYPT